MPLLEQSLCSEITTVVNVQWRSWLSATIKKLDIRGMGHHFHLSWSEHDN